MKHLRVPLSCYVLVGCLMPASVFAHVHCDIKSWGPLTSSNVLPTLPYSVSAGKDAFAIFFQPLLNDPPPPGSSECKYEISDVTQVSLTLTFTGQLAVSTINFGGLGSGVVAEADAPVSFVSGVTRTFQLEPHGGADAGVPGPSEQSMPSNLYQVTLQGFDVGADFTVMAASISLSGHHYYLPVPEPASSALAAAGVFAAGASLRRRATAKANDRQTPAA